MPQSRFADDLESRFDIDVTAKDQTILKILEAGGGWTEPLSSRRGAEISKSGKGIICPRCGAARPLPKTDQAACFTCSTILSSGSATRIVARTPVGGGAWARFIAGEDVRRYSVRPERWIRTDVRGISYKAQARRGEHRLLVRTTGVGLNAAIDISGSFTNQVVFEYTLGEASRFPFSYLHYVLGILCSRVLFAFHLKRGGDLEWRSHPYVTQKTLAALPIPVPKPGTQGWKQAAAIAQAVSRFMETGEKELEIEALVAGLYRLEHVDMLWAMDVLNEAADLEPMRLLRLPSGLGISPVVVD